jgi:hypothetical protein
VPISNLQSAILRHIAGSRDPESFVAGGLPLNRHGPRFSDDIDIFHEREERVARASEHDVALLLRAGYHATWLRREAGIYSAEISDSKDKTKLEWVADSDFRYFPALKDEEFGYVLHPVDLAVNKLMASVSRREPRDIMDLVRVHERYLPLGAIVWAAVVIAPGFSPEGLLAELRRNARFEVAAFARVRVDVPIDAGEVMRTLRDAITSAEEFVHDMPTAQAGTVYLEQGQPVQPDPKRLSDYVRHGPQRRGHWPSSSDLTAAMREKLQTTAP